MVIIFEAIEDEEEFLIVSGGKPDIKMVILEENCPHERKKKVKEKVVKLHRFFEDNWSFVLEQ